jgi:hypothetical protein
LASRLNQFSGADFCAKATLPVMAMIALNLNIFSICIIYASKLRKSRGIYDNWK